MDPPARGWSGHARSVTSSARPHLLYDLRWNGGPVTPAVSKCSTERLLTKLLALILLRGFRHYYGSLHPNRYLDIQQQDMFDAIRLFVLHRVHSVTWKEVGNDADRLISHELMHCTPHGTSKQETSLMHDERVPLRALVSPNRSTASPSDASYRPPRTQDTVQYGTAMDWSRSAWHRGGQHVELRLSLARFRHLEAVISTLDSVP